MAEADVTLRNNKKIAILALTSTLNLTLMLILTQTHLIYKYVLFAKKCAHTKSSAHTDHRKLEGTLVAKLRNYVNQN